MYYIIKLIISNGGLRKHYFANISTIMLPTFFILMSLLVFFDEIQWYSMFDDVDLTGIGAFLKTPSFVALKTILEDSVVVWVSGVAIVVFCYMYHTAKGIKEALKKPEKKMDLPSPIIIDVGGSEDLPPITMKNQNDKLEEFLNEALEKRKYAFIVAGSGSGKSTMMRKYENGENEVLRHLRKVFRIADYNITEQKRKDIDSLLDKRKEITASTIVFDQFEATLKNEEHKNWFLECKSKKKQEIFFIFICKKESFSDILRVYDLPPNDYGLHHLWPVNDDREKFEEEWFSVIENPETSDGKKFHTALLNGFFNGTVRFIEMNIVRSYLKKMTEDKEKVLVADVYSEETGTAVKKIVKLYFDALFSASENPVAAMAMMYSLCYSGQLTKNKMLNMNNFKDLTFEEETILENILKLFEEQNLVQKAAVKEPNNYRVAHEYLFNHIEVYCEETMPAQILSNIRVYCNEMDDVHATGISLCCAIFQRDGARHRIRLMPAVIVMLSLVLLAASVFLLYRDEYKFSFDPVSSPVLACLFNGGAKAAVDSGRWLPETFYAFAIVAIGGSICYIFQYMERFARIFLKWKNGLSVRSFFLAWSLIVWGSIACVFAMLWTDWGIAFLASEFILVGCLHIVLQHSCHPNAKAQFKDEGLTFIGIGLVFLIMNCFIHYTGQAMHTWYAMYSLFMFFTVHNHIKTDYLVAKLGSFSTKKSWGKGKQSYE